MIMVFGFCALPLIAIYLYTKFYLNAYNSFKVVRQGTGQTDGQSGNYMLSPLGSIKMCVNPICG